MEVTRERGVPFCWTPRSQRLSFCCGGSACSRGVVAGSGACHASVRPSRARARECAPKRVPPAGQLARGSRASAPATGLAPRAAAACSAAPRPPHARRTHLSRSGAPPPPAAPPSARHTASSCAQADAVRGQRRSWRGQRAGAGGHAAGAAGAEAPPAARTVAGRTAWRPRSRNPIPRPGSRSLALEAGAAASFFF